MTMDRRTLQSLLILALVGLMPAVCPDSAASVLAADASETAGQSQTGEKDKSDEQADKKDEEDPGELFPGVKGISGKELARRIAEIERKKKQRQKQRPTTAADTTSRPPARSRSPAFCGCRLNGTSPRTRQTCSLTTPKGRIPVSRTGRCFW